MVSAMLCKLQWLLLVPNSHVFGRLVGDDIQRVRRVHSVCLFEDTYVCVVIDVAGNGRIFPGKRRRKGFLGSGARVCMVMPMLRRAQACQRVAGVVRIGMFSGFIPQSLLSLTTTQDVSCQTFPAVEIARGLVRSGGWLHTVQSRLNQWPAAAHPVTVAPIY
jgi:hypothetical protein